MQSRFCGQAGPTNHVSGCNHLLFTFLRERERERERERVRERDRQTDRQTESGTKLC